MKHTDKWQPIETAPKDGTAILAVVGDKITTVEYDKNPYHEQWCLCVCGAYAESDNCSPTHWQPLPKPPVSA